MRLSLRKPDDWHLHVRDGAALNAVVRHTARQFQRAVIMPNLVPPVVTVDQALAYRERVLAAANSGGAQFEPLMTLYLTEKTSVEDIRRAAGEATIIGAKLYPAGATTNSDAGVTSLAAIDDVLAVMEEEQFPLLVHGEVTASHVDVFDRESNFVSGVLDPLLRTRPMLRVVVEHVTTRDAVNFVRSAGDSVAATITPQHLLFDRNHLLVGGVKPHLYCLPVLKRASDREALIEAATSGESSFFLGTDSAPHARSTKENACGCAGCFSAPVAMELYAEAFDRAGAMDKLEAFASEYGARFYGRPLNTQNITLEKSPWTVPDVYPFGKETIVPLAAGETLAWRCVDHE